MMRVAVTGGSGFIGKRLVLRHLARGDEVRVLSRRPVEPGRVAASAIWFQADLGDLARDTGFVEGVDVLYHCAGETREPARMELVNVQGTRKLIEAARGRVGRWVQLSSVGAYGPKREGVVTENSAMNPRGQYEASKAEADRLVQAAAVSGAFEHVILRPSNVFGGGMVNQSLFGLMSMIDRGLFFFIGRPGASANYIHVDNVVEALMRCGSEEAARGELFNLSDYRTMEQFAGAIAMALGKRPPTRRLPEPPVRALARMLGHLPGFPLTASRVDAMTIRAVYSTEKIERVLNYRHRITMEAGLQELAESWRESHRR